MSKAPWNDPNILQPVINTYKYQNNIADIESLIEHFVSAVKLYKLQSTLHQEAAMVSRVIYLIGKKLRHDIGLSYMKKTNAALQRYLSLDIVKLVETFHYTLPRLNNSEIIYAPTRQMFEFVLLRLQTLSLILSRITKCAFKSASFFFDRLKKGDVAWMSLIPYSVLSKVWTMTGNLLRKSTKFYSEILPLRLKLEEIGPSFLPNYEFPMCIETWIKDQIPEDDYVLQSQMRDSIDSKSFQMADKILKRTLSIEETDSKQIESNITVASEDKSKCFTSYSGKAKNNMDLGVSLSREDMEIIMESLKSEDTVQKETPEKITKVVIHSVDSIIGKKALDDFLEREEHFRATSDPKSLSSHIGFMQWQTVKKLMLKISRESSKGVKFSKKIILQMNQLWKERCEKN